MAPVPSLVLLKTILDAQLRGHASEAASMLVGPNSYTKNTLLLNGLDVSLFLKLDKF